MIVMWYAAPDGSSRVRYSRVCGSSLASSRSLTTVEGGLTIFSVAMLKSVGLEVEVQRFDCCCIRIDDDVSRKLEEKAQKQSSRRVVDRSRVWGLSWRRGRSHAVVGLGSFSNITLSAISGPLITESPRPRPAEVGPVQSFDGTTTCILHSTNRQRNPWAPDLYGETSRRQQMI